MVTKKKNFKTTTKKAVVKPAVTKQLNVKIPTKVASRHKRQAREDGEENCR